MKRRFTYLILIPIFCFLISQEIKAQWRFVNGFSEQANIIPGSISSITVTDKGIFAATNSGVYLSSDEGNSWEATSLKNYAYNIVSENSAILAQTGNSVFLSTDDGKTWKVIYNSNVRGINLVNSTIYLNTGNNIKMSKNWGTTWSDLFGNLSFGIECFDVKNDTILIGRNYDYTECGNFVEEGLYYFLIKENKFVRTSLSNLNIYAIAHRGSTICASSDKNLYISTNNGESWQLSSSKTNIDEYDGGNILFYKNNLFIASGTISQSSDNGKSWIRIDTLLNSNKNIDQLVSYQNTIYANTYWDGIYISNTDGKSWQKTIKSNTPVPINKIGKTNNYLIAITDSKAYFSRDGGNIWNENSTGLDMGDEVIQFMSIDDSIPYLFTSYNHTNHIYYFNNKDKVWKIKLQNIALSPTAFYVVHGDIYIADNSTPDWEGGCYKFSNNNWIQLNTPFAVAFENLFINYPHIICYQIFSPTTLYGLWISPDMGKTWNHYDINDPIVPDYVRCINFDDSAIYLGTDDGLFISKDFGNHWSLNNQITHINNIVLDGKKIILNSTYFSDDGGISYKNLNPPGNFNDGIINNNNFFADGYSYGLWECNLYPLTNTIFNISYSGNTTLCQNDSIQLHAKPGKNFTYQWQINSNNILNANDSIYFAKDDGTYSVVITDSSRYNYQSHTVAVKVKPKPIANISINTSSVLCSGDTLVITADILTIGQKNIEYKWQKNNTNLNGETKSALTVKTAGMYNLVVKDSCNSTVSDSILITNDIIPEANIVSIGSTTRCPGDSVILYSSTNINPDYYEDFERGNLKKFNWQVSGAAMYHEIQGWGIDKDTVHNGKNALHVKIIDVPIGCADSPTFYANSALKVTIDYPINDSITFYYYSLQKQSSVRFDFSINNKVVESFGNSNGWQKATFPVMAGTNNLQWSVSSYSGYAGTNDVWLDDINFRKYTGFAYQWLKDGNNIIGATSYQYAAKAKGSYTLTVKGKCFTSISPPITVNFYNPPDSSLTILQDTSNVCRKGALTIEAPNNKNYIYRWLRDGINIMTADSSNYKLYANNSGFYKVVIKDSTGCKATASENVKIDKLINSNVNYTGTGYICYGKSLALNVLSDANNTYQWKLNNKDIPGATSYTYTADSSGFYSVEISNILNCKEISNPVIVKVHQNQAIISSDQKGFCKNNSSNINLYTNYSLFEDFETGTSTIHDLTSSSWNGGKNWFFAQPGANGSKYCFKSGTVNNGGSELSLSFYTSKDDSIIFYRKTRTDNLNTLVLNFQIWYNINQQNIIREKWAGNTEWKRMSYPVKAGYVDISWWVSGICNQDSLGMYIDNIAIGSGQNISYQWQKDGYNIGLTSSNVFSTNATGSYTVKLTDECGTIISKPYKIVNSTLNPAVTSTDDNSNPCIKGAKIFSATEGKGYKYYWGNSKDTLSILDANKSGWYYLYVYDSLGCSQYISKDINGNSLQTNVTIAYNAIINSPKNTYICEGSTVDLTVSSNSMLNYQWYQNNIIINGATNTALNINSAGVYKAVIDWANQCADTSGIIRAYMQSKLNPDSIYSGNNGLCSGDSIKITSNSGFYEDFENGTLDNLNCKWINDSINPWFIEQQYYYNNGYKLIYSAISGLTNYNAKSELKLSLNLISCDSIFFSYSIGSQYDTLEFYINDTLKSKYTPSRYYYGGKVTYPIRPGNINVKWMFKNSDSSSINTVPIYDYAIVDNISISANNVNFQWEKEELPIAGATNMNYYAKEAGKYSLVTTNACDDISSNIIEIKNGTPLSLTKANSNDICLPGIKILTAITDNGNEYQWFKDNIIINNATTSTYQAKRSGIYYVEVKSPNGCESISDTAKVIVNPMVSANIIPSGKISYCFDSLVNILANNNTTGIRYQWQKNNIDIEYATESSFLAGSSGNYRVVEINDYNCADTSSSLMIIKKPMPEITLDTMIKTCSSNKYLLDAGYGFNLYSWSSGYRSRSIVLDSSGVGVGIMNYSVTVTSQNGCVESFKGKLDFENCSGISELNNELGFNIYPNPNDGKFTLKISNQYTINRNMNLNIFALLGQTVYSESLEMSNKEFYKRINLSNLSKGLYFIRISDSKNDFTGKIVIQ